MSVSSQQLRKQDNALTVLIVDDERHTLKYFSKLFGSEFEVITCSGAEEAEAAFEERDGNISVIVSDHRMPETTGVTLLSRVKARWPNTIRLLTTAYADTDALAASINDAAIHGYISKPWDLDDLRKALETASRAFRDQIEERGKPAGSSAVSVEPLPPPPATAGLPPLFSTMAHEMATPLLSIEMTSRALLDSANEQIAESHSSGDSKTVNALARFVRAIQRIGQDAAQARRLARSLAELARDTTARSSFKRVAISHCVRAAVESYPFKPLERRWLTLLLDDDFTFIGTDVLMGAVVTNVLSNAMEAIRDVDGPHVLIRTQAGSAYNSLIVCDNGPGLDGDMQAHVFKPFISGRYQGTGLGLAISDWIVRSFGGQIYFRRHDQQTEFEVRLPHPKPFASR